MWVNAHRCLWLLEQYLAAYSQMKVSLTPPPATPTVAGPPNAPATSSSTPDAAANTLDASTVAMLKDITLIVEVLQGEKYLLRMSSEKFLVALKQEIANRMDVVTISPPLDPFICTVPVPVLLIVLNSINLIK
jgi:hypothetical protein